MSAQILAVLIVMLPAMNSLGKLSSISYLIDAEVLLHHSLGLGVMAIWVYVDLVYLRRLRVRISLKSAMRTATVFWLVSLLLGIHIYSEFYS